MAGQTPDAGAGLVGLPGDLRRSASVSGRAAQDDRKSILRRSARQRDPIFRPPLLQVAEDSARPGVEDQIALQPVRRDSTLRVRVDNDPRCGLGGNPYRADYVAVVLQLVNLVRVFDRTIVEIVTILSGCPESDGEARSRKPGNSRPRVNGFWRNTRNLSARDFSSKSRPRGNRPSTALDWFFTGRSGRTVCVRWGT